MESQFHVVVFLDIMIDTLAKTKIVTFALNLSTAEVRPRPCSHEGNSSG